MSTKLDWEEARELADVIIGTSNPEEDYAVTELALCEKWNVSLDDFHEIANGIFKLIDLGLSPLTNKAFVGISEGNRWIAKKECDQQFIGGLIQWCTEGNELPADSNGYIRTITTNGKPEFDITISHAGLSDSGLKSEAN